MNRKFLSEEIGIAEMDSEDAFGQSFSARLKRDRQIRSVANRVRCVVVEKIPLEVLVETIRKQYGSKALFYGNELK